MLVFLNPSTAAPECQKRHYTKNTTDSCCYGHSGPENWGPKARTCLELVDNLWKENYFSVEGLRQWKSIKTDGDEAMYDKFLTQE